MIIKRLRLDNFKSYETLDLELADRSAGVYFVEGRNECAPELGGNAVGKSSMWDGLVWVLYGKSIRGLQGGELLRWDSDKKGYSGQVDMVLHGDEISVKRTWNPNALQWSYAGSAWEAVNQVDIVKTLRLTYQAFLHAVILGQFSTMFLEIPAPDKEALFSAALDLDSWLEMSADAAEAAKKERGKLDSFRRELESVKGNISGVDLDGLLESSSKWEEENVRVLDASTERAAKLTESVQGADKRLSTALGRESRVKREEGAEEGLESDLKAEREELRHHSDKYSRWATTLRILGEDESQLVKAAEDYGKCYLCGNEITEDHLRKELRKIEAEKKEALENYEQERKDKREIKINIMEMERGLKENRISREAKHSKLNREIREAQEDLHRLKMELKDVEAHCQRLSIDNPYTAMISKAKDKQEGLQSQRSVLRQLVRSHRSKEEASRYWVNGFKAIRLRLISNSLAFLEIEVANSLRALGLEGWSIRFGIDKKTKKGTLKRGFSVFVKSPGTDNEVRWESWSGGETQRMVLAGQLGFSNLIQGLTGADCNIEVYDEPTNHLSPAGIDSLLLRLQERAEASNKVIFLLDHRSLEFGGFAGRLVVSIDGQGNSNVIEEILDHE